MVTAALPTGAWHGRTGALGGGRDTRDRPFSDLLVLDADKHFAAAATGGRTGTYGIRESDRSAC